MATHHGRPGGRLLEVLLALVLAVLSGAFLVLCLVVPTYLLSFIGLKSGRKAAGKLVIGAFMGGIYLLKFPWNALLKYYRYQPHTLKPILDETDRDAGDGGEGKEDSK